MNKVIEWFTKEKVLFFSIIGSLLFGGTIFYIENFYLKGNYPCGLYCDNIWIHSLIFVPVLICSIVSFKMKNEVFTNWIKFTFWFFIISTTILAIAPVQCDAYLRICKEALTWVISVLYFAFSIIMITYKSVNRSV